jgi:hypothetical protein
MRDPRDTAAALMAHVTAPKYWRGLRIHHGAVGVLMAGVGALLALHDRRDFPFRLHDRR